MAMQEILIGTVKGPGENPHEFTFITTDNTRTRIGEFVYYHTSDGENELRIVGAITGRALYQGTLDFRQAVATAERKLSA